MEPLEVVALSDLLVLELLRVGVRLPMRPLPKSEECRAPYERFDAIEIGSIRVRIGGEQRFRNLFKP
jgi:hypothetical protein